MADENNPYERDPMNAFDFYFSDISERDGAWQHALKENLKVMGETNGDIIQKEN